MVSNAYAVLTATCEARRLTELKLFELVTGQPPFDSILSTPKSLVRQMLETVDDELPTRWQQTFDRVESTASYEGDGLGLRNILEDVYFEDGRV